LVRALETWVFGAILAIVGFLVIFCSVGENGLGVPFFMGGLASASAGSLIFVFNFKHWVENL
jgi:ABC-type enterobactin transport system permease subunit